MVHSRADRPHDPEVDAANGPIAARAPAGTELERSLAKALAEIADLRLAIAARNEQLIELRNLSGALDCELAQLRGSRAYRLAVQFRRVWHGLVPPRSRRSTAARFIARAIRKARFSPLSLPAAVGRLALNSVSVASARAIRFVGAQSLLSSTVFRHLHAPSPAMQDANRRQSVHPRRTKSPSPASSPATMPSRAAKQILFQVDDFHQGGLENITLGLARGLKRAGMEVALLILGGQGPAAEQARQIGLDVLPITRRRRERLYRNLLAERKVDAVSAHFSTFGARIAAGLGIPFVQVVHNSYVWLQERAIERYRQADQATSGYICVSAEVARYSESRLGLSASKMIVVPNGIDGPRLDAARGSNPADLRDELGFSADDFVFLNVASIHATKGQKLLIKALASLITTHPKARVVIVGSASDREYECQLRRLIRHHGLARRVVLAGQRDDVARFYWMADVFVLPSYWEGWSLALTEAVYTGLPVVATDVGGARDLLAERQGWLVKPPFSTISELNGRTIARLVHADDDELVARLASAMSSACHSGSRAVLAEPAKRLLEEEHMIQRHRTILDGLIEGRHPADLRAETETTTPAFELARAS
jgi:glycosyltransferase involved in cell wall biosynthesis